MLKAQVLSILELKKGKLVTGGELSRKLGVSRTAIWKVMRALREDGCDITAIKNSGYIFSPDNDLLSEALIRKRLSAKILGNRIEILKTVDSTNLYLKRQNLWEIEEGMVVIADEQTNGLGRMNRSFASPGGDGVYMSFVLKPRILPMDIQFLTICAAVAVCRALEAVCGIEPKIKWVNDIFYGGKKLCGILSEAVISAETQNIEHVIVGIGINTGPVPKEVDSIATSLYKITGKRAYRNDLIAEILSQFENVYLGYLNADQRAAIVDEYTKRLFILGKRVCVDNFNVRFLATVTGVDPFGALIVKNDDSETIHLYSGEVRPLWEDLNL